MKAILTKGIYHSQYDSLTKPIWTNNDSNVLISIQANVVVKYTEELGYFYSRYPHQ